MLLNEVQKQRKTIEALEQRLEQLEARLARGK
jgi:BMFP domain-containing protein YqiC